MPNEAQQRINRARILVGQSRWKEAEAELGRALSAQSVDRSLALYYLAWSQLAQGRYEEALATAARTIAEDPELARGYHVRAVTLRKKGDLAMGEEAARLCIQKDSETSEYRSELAWNLIVQGRAKEALEVAESGLAKHPESGNLLRARTDALILAGQLEAADDNARRALAMDAEDAISMTQLGVIHFKQGALAEAERHFAEALRLRPGYDFAGDYLRKTMREKLWFHRFISPGWKPVPSGYMIALVAATAGLRSFEWGLGISGILFSILIVFWFTRWYGMALSSAWYGLALRSNPLSGGILTREEADFGVCVAFMLGGACVCFALAVLGVSPALMAAMGVLLFLLPLPLSRAFEGSKRQRLIANIYTDLFALVGAGSCFAFYIGAKDEGNFMLIVAAAACIAGVPMLRILFQVFMA